MAFGTGAHKQEAEEKFGSSIYDQIKPPEELQELNILEIPNWNTNAVKGMYQQLPSNWLDGSFLPSTGCLNAIQMERINFRPQKTHVEFCFEVVPDSDPRSAGLRGDAAIETAKPAATPKPVAMKVNMKTVGQYSEELIDFFFKQLEKHGNSAEGKENLRRALLAECSVTLNAVQNVSFAAGFKAKE